MSVYESAKNAFAIIGLLTVSGFIGLAGWHITATVRRFRANRPIRLQQRAIAAARNAPASSATQQYGDDSFGDC